MAVTEQQARARVGRRTIATYGTLVVVPVVLAVLFLLAQAGGGDRRGPDIVDAPANGLPRLFVAVLVVVVACHVVGLLARRLGQPAVIGQIATGILLGPSVLGAIWPAAMDAIVPAAVLPQLGTLAQLGVVLFVFLAGLEMDPRRLRGQRHIAVVVSHVGIAVPFLLGVLLAFFAYSPFAPDGVGLVPFALFIGVSMSITALPVMVSILMDTGLLRTQLGMVALTCALVDDVSAWCLLALVVALVVSGSVAGVLVTMGLTVLFAGILLFAVRPLMQRTDRTFAAQRPEQAVVAALVGLFCCAMLTGWIGVHEIFGAFLFGLMIPADSAWTRSVEGAIRGLTTSLLLPVFFTYNGLHTEIGLLGLDPQLWLWTGAILTVAVAGKFGGATLAALAVGSSWPRAVQIGALMNCRGLTELVVLNIGLSLGVLSPTLFTMLVIMTLVSTAMATPIVVRFRGRASAAGVL